MNDPEIHYQIPHNSGYPDDHEKIIVAIGVYQRELPFPADHHHDARIADTADGTVSLKLVRTILTAESHDQLQKLADDMRRGVEDHFEPEDSLRLKGYFVETPLPKNIQQ